MDQKFKEIIRDIKDFPKKGIVFKDITTLLNNAEYYHLAIDEMYEKIKDENIDYIVGIEARGFIFGAALAYKLKKAFVPIRKSGKLPYKTYRCSYSLEYGRNTMEIHTDALKDNSNVVIVDDLMATGGSVIAAVNLISNFNVSIKKLLFFIELVDLKGRGRILEKLSSENFDKKLVENIKVDSILRV